MSDHNDDDIEDDIGTEEDDADLLPAGSPHSPYDLGQVLDQHRRVMRQMLRRQRRLIAQVGELQRSERDRKLYGKIVISLGTILLAIFSAVGSYLGGFWGKHS